MADIDGDSNPDLVWQNTQTGDVTYWLMHGINFQSSGFIASGVPLDWKIESIEDVNDDLHFDLIWRNIQSSDVTVWYMNGLAWTGAYDYIAHGIPLEWSLVRAH